MRDARQALWQHDQPRALAGELSQQVGHVAARGGLDEHQCRPGLGGEAATWLAGERSKDVLARVQHDDGHGRLDAGEQRAP